MWWKAIGTMAAPVGMRYWEGSCMKIKRICTNARVSGRASLCSLNISGSRCRMDSNPRDADVFCNIIKNVSFLKSQKRCVCVTVTETKVEIRHFLTSASAGPARSQGITEPTKSNSVFEMHYKPV